MNTERERLCYHAAALAVESDYRRLALLFRTRGSWESAWDRLRAEEPRAQAITPQEAWKDAAHAGIELVLPTEEAYPPLLREIPHPPFGIYVRGTLPASAAPAVAIVGTRRATPAGKAAAEAWGEALTRAGVTVVSGLAFGVDAGAHRGSIAGGGPGIAVLANGLDAPYPRAHERLAKDLLRAGGTLISEYPPGAPPFPSRFLERNRIVSGLARGVLVIEAPEKSGALVTARFAVEQNREVLVLPGPARHPNFAGSHALIRDGAELVTEPRHILEALGIAPSAGDAARTLDDLTPAEHAVFEALGKHAEPATVDKIISLTHLEAHAANEAVTLLFLKDMIREEQGTYLIR